MAKLGFIISIALLVMGIICSPNVPHLLRTDGVKTVDLSLPFPATATPENTLPTDSNQQESGYDATVKLFGIIPIGNTRMTVEDPDRVMVGGTPFGIKIMAEGVLVVDFRDVETQTGNQNPAKSAGVKKGDLVLAVNDRSIATNGQLQSIVANSKGQAVRLLIQREGKTLTLTLYPVLSTDGSYRIGMWVRDSTAGLGTMTFYHPATGTYAGLGHGVCDTDTGKLMTVLTGEIVSANINSIKKGTAGTAGEIRGTLISNSPLGSILTNCHCGVYGQCYTLPSQGKTVTVAYKQEVVQGNATLLSSVSGSVQEYTCTIEKIDLKDSTTQNMVVRITDPDLLNLTGGIIQGMSGSPILQNGKLVGAITHVFVNDPTAGYGVFAETMLNTATKTAKQITNKAS